jgi:hypothetical protein
MSYQVRHVADEPDPAGSGERLHEFQFSEHSLTRGAASSVTKVLHRTKPSNQSLSSSSDARADEATSPYRGVHRHRRRLCCTEQLTLRLIVLAQYPYPPIPYVEQRPPLRR